MERSALAVTVVLTVAALFPAAGSVTPAAPTLAPFVTVPVAEGLIENVAVKVMGVPGLSAAIVKGTPPLHGAVAETNVSPAPGASVTTALVTFDGPLFATVNEYVMF